MLLMVSRTRISNSVVSEDWVSEEKHMISELCASGRDMNPGFFCPIYRELRSSSNSIALGKAVRYFISHLCADI